MGKKGKRVKSSSSESEEDPTELLTKQVKKQQTIIDAQNSGSPSSLQTGRKIIDRPPARVNGVFVVNPNVPYELLLFGGESSDGNLCKFFGDSYIFNTKNSTWTQFFTAPTPSPRSAHQAVVFSEGNFMILFGGEFGTSKETKFLHFSDTWIFDFVTYNWRALPLKKHPPSRSGHRMARVGQFVILFGGFQDTGSQTTYLDDLWIFDTVKMEWNKIELINEFESKPCARSGFSWVTHTDGILLYGGYCQVKAKNGSLKGQALNDLWLLKVHQNDPSNVRWKKLKLSSNAPIPRSGTSSVHHKGRMINFGGVIDEEVSDEFLIGTCLSDLYSYGFADNSWDRIEVSPTKSDFDKSSFCGRFNSMITVHKDTFYLYGGIHEAPNDETFTLDDLYQIDLNTLTFDRLQDLSSTLQGCWNIKQTVNSSDDDDSQSDPSSIDDSSNDDDSSDNDLSSTSDNRDSSGCSDGKPVASSYRTLKEFFDSNQEFWLNQAQIEMAEDETNEKKLRSLAFQIAKREWDEQQLQLNLSL